MLLLLAGIKGVRAKKNVKNLQNLFPLVMEQEGFQSPLDKLINGLLYFRPVAAMIFEHHAVDRKASVHLEIENSFGLFKGQEAVFHRLR